jgi:hypothetical protein
MAIAPQNKRVAKASPGVIGSSSRFERMLIESGAFAGLSPQDVLQLQHTIEQVSDESIHLSIMVEISHQ